MTNEPPEQQSSQQQEQQPQDCHKELKLGIAGFYDRSSKLWEDVWGEHMHHVSVAAFVAVVSVLLWFCFVAIAVGAA